MRPMKGEKVSDPVFRTSEAKQLKGGNHIDFHSESAYNQQVEPEDVNMAEGIVVLAPEDMIVKEGSRKTMILLVVCIALAAIILVAGLLVIFLYTRGGEVEMIKEPETIVSAANDFYEHRLSYQLDGTTAKFSLWHGPIDPENQKDFSLYELAEYEHNDGTELVAKWAIGITNAKWMEGKRGGVDETDWSQGVLNDDEWGDGLYAVYGFRSE